MYPDGMPDDTRSVKRRSERKRVQMIVTLVIEGDDAEYLADTVDLSPDGLRLQSDATFAPGQFVGLLRTTEPACVIKARVDWVGNADPTRYGQAGMDLRGGIPRDCTQWRSGVCWRLGGKTLMEIPAKVLVPPCRDAKPALLNHMEA
jgi:hypothetical protein